MVPAPALLDLTLTSPELNLALDEAMLLEAEAGTGGEVLRFWELSSPAVILGSGGIVSDDVHLEACRANGIPVLRRSSGGGTVILGEGCLLFTLILRYERDFLLEQIRSSYLSILGTVQRALREKVEVQIAGISDLTYQGKKWSGNSQQRKRHHLLHHGTILYGFDLSLVTRYLKEPPRRPEYRENRSHSDFVGNLPLPAWEIKERMARAWQAEEKQCPWPEERTQELAREKYGLSSWTFRR